MNETNVAVHQHSERLLGFAVGEFRQQFGVIHFFHSTVICAPKAKGDKVFTRRVGPRISSIGATAMARFNSRFWALERIFGPAFLPLTHALLLRRLPSIDNIVFQGGSSG